MIQQEKSTEATGNATGVKLDDVMTPREVAARLRTSTERVWALIRSKRLHALDLGTPSKSESRHRPTWRIPVESFRRYLAGETRPRRVRAGQPGPRKKRMPPGDMDASRA